MRPPGKRTGANWLAPGAVYAIQRELVARYGGKAGVREPALLDMVMARPQHLTIKTAKAPIAIYAAAYGWGMLKSRPFEDGNKRTALATMVVFLDSNGWELACHEVEETVMVQRAAAGHIKEREWTEWVQGNVRRKR
jgi:death on curing protein